MRTSCRHGRLTASAEATAIRRFDFAKATSNPPKLYAKAGAWREGGKVDATRDRRHAGITTRRSN
jgi:hypothetical protein